MPRRAATDLETTSERTVSEAICNGDSTAHTCPLIPQDTAAFCSWPRWHHNAGLVTTHHAGDTRQPCPNCSTAGVIPASCQVALAGLRGTHAFQWLARVLL